MARPTYTWNSDIPPAAGDEIYVECEIGLDQEEIYYIKQNNDIQLRIGAEPFYLFQRQSGSLATGTVSSWEQVSSQYIGTLWTAGDAESSHPDIRTTEDTFVLFNDGVVMTRVWDSSYINADTEYYITKTAGTSTSDAGNIKVYLNTSFTPGTITYRANTLCSCVDIESGYPNRECTVCQGTATPAGFSQYIVSSSKYSPANTILIRVPKVVETLPAKIIGKVRTRQNRHWTTPVPYLYNYDVLVGTIGRNEGKVFEIIGKYDSRMRGILLHQEFDTLLIDPNDVRYNFTIVT